MDNWQGEAFHVEMMAADGTVIDRKTFYQANQAGETLVDQ
jgi:hypothetical protein